MTALILFAGRGSVDWTQGWIFLLYSHACPLLVSGIIIGRRADLLLRRTRKYPDEEVWDRWLLFVIGKMGWLTLATAALEARIDAPRFWFNTATLFGIFLMTAGWFVIGAAMYANSNFETHVRIQHEADHRVCADGPYRWLRHPGYLGWICVYLAQPFMLNAKWGLIPAGLAAGLFGIRTYLEDRMLRRRLEGYAAYAGQIKWRLIPGIF